MTRTWTRSARIAAWAVAGVLGLVVLGVLVLTRTDFGRERLRGLIEDQVAAQVDGRVRIGALEGDLLTGVTLRDLEITDSAGAPFLSVRSASLGYSLSALLSRRIRLSDVRLVEPVIVLDQPPGEPWNFERILPSDTTPEAAPADTAPGFGSWLRISDLVVVDGRVVVRSAWSPPEELEGAARDSAVARALSPGSRERVVEVAGGYQRVAEVSDLDARLPLLRLADPDSAAIRVELASLQAVVRPFEPPPLRIRDAAGVFVVGEDSVHFQEVRLVLPESRLGAEGRYALETGVVRAAVVADTLALSDLEWLRPDLPAGGGELRVGLAGPTDALRVAASGVRLRVGEAGLRGEAGVVLGDPLRVEGADLRFEDLDPRLVERLVPGLALPLEGTAEGRIEADGPLSHLAVDADVAFRRTGGGVSRAAAVGGVTLGGEGAFGADSLRVDLRPLELGVARAFAPDLPLEGALTGQALVDGSTATSLAARLDLTHAAPTGTSRVAGEAVLAGTDPLRFQADLRVPRLALETVERIAPGGELRGTVSGEVEVEGTPRDLSFAADLRVAEGGRLALLGAFDRSGSVPTYRGEAVLEAFDAGAVSGRAPRTALTGTLDLQGRGFDPATAEALLEAELRDPTLDSAGVVEAGLRVEVDDGLARVDRGEVRLASASLELEGAFGVVAARSGELRYRLRVDSLSDFAHHFAADTGVVHPRPVARVRALARARADSLRRFRETVVERAATGYPPSPELRVDSVPPLARDSVAGRLELDGVVRGDVERFGTTGEAVLADVVAMGNAASSARVEYEVRDVRTPEMDVAVEAGADSLRVAGFFFDSASVQGSLRGGLEEGSGTFGAGIHQDGQRDYRLAGEYVLAADGSRLVLDDFGVRFGERVWASGDPATIRWGGDVLAVEGLQLRNGEGGRLAVEVALAGEGPVEGVVDVERLPVDDVLAVLQDTATADGLISFHAELAGTRAAPVLQGTLGLREAAVEGEDFPNVAARFAYDDRTLEAEAALARSGSPLLVAEARVPMDLSLTGDSVRRIGGGPLAVDLRVDSLPLDVLPSLTDAVSDVRGRVAGTVAVRGTLEEPEVEGMLALDLGRLDVETLGVPLRDVEGVLAVRGDSVVVDSLVARAEGGRIRVEGVVGIARPTEPSFDLAVQAREALVLDNATGRLVVGADLTVAGPFDGVVVRGDAQLVEGVVYVPEQEKDVVDLDRLAVAQALDSLEKETDVVDPPSPLLENLAVDVDLGISRNTWVRNRDANVEIHTPDGGDPLEVELDSERRVLILRGVINADYGEYSFAGRRFDLTSGSLTFIGDPEIDPLMQLTAVHEVPQSGREDLVLEVNVGGRLQDPRITLSSNREPPLSQTDLISYLVFGRSSSSLLEQGSSGVTGGSGRSLGALATQKLAGVALGTLLDEAVSDLEQEAGESGLDMIRISPASLPEELAFDSYLDNLLRGTEIEAGKYFGRRLFVAAQGRPTTEVWPGVRLEYRFPTQGLTWSATWEPRFLPSVPTLVVGQRVFETRVFGSFLVWERRF